MMLPRDRRKLPQASSSGSPLGAKEWITFIFSALALCVASASLYVANFRVKDAALARIADLKIVPGDARDSTEGYRNGFVLIRLACVNPGNRSAVILKSEYQLSDQPNLDDGGFGDDVVTDSDLFPILLPAHEIKVVDVKIPMAFILNNYDSGSPVTGPSPRQILTRAQAEPLRRFYAGLRFQALDSQGNVHESWTGMQVVIEISRSRWEGMRPLNAKDPFHATSLVAMDGSGAGR